MKVSDGTSRSDRSFDSPTELGFAETEGIAFEGNVRISWDSSKGSYLQGAFAMTVPVEAGETLSVNFSHTSSSKGSRDLLIDGEIVASTSSTSATTGLYTVPAGVTSVIVEGSAGLNYYGITRSRATEIATIEAQQTITYNGSVVTADGIIEVYNMQGHLVRATRNSVDVTPLERGIYIVRCGNAVRKIVR